MAKKDQIKKSPPQKSRFFFYLAPIFLGFGFWWIWNEDLLSNWKEQLFNYIDNRDIATLESRFTPEEILDRHRQSILGSDKEGKSIKNTSLMYYPYLLLEVKFMADQKPKEGSLLWGMTDGEIVLNTSTWETTHGFRDCLECHANRNDFKILQSLAKYNGGVSIEELQKELKIEREVLDPWIEETKKKHLIVVKGNFVQLHFEQPKLLVNPQTHIKEPIVSKPQGMNQKATRNFGRSQILTLAKAAFGNEFKIRSEEEIYLPVFRFEVFNYDGSVQVSEWNALTGQKIIPRYLTKK
ncbi:MAG: hypothetical protein Q8K60_09655 [Parachlamydiaceae bacterium]|nr:hypothetical protein [Parachlamydiaceae bacterium]